MMTPEVVTIDGMEYTIIETMTANEVIKTKTDLAFVLEFSKQIALKPLGEMSDEEMHNYCKGMTLGAESDKFMLTTVMKYIAPPTDPTKVDIKYSHLALLFAQIYYLSTNLKKNLSKPLNSPISSTT